MLARESARSTVEARMKALLLPRVEVWPPVKHGATIARRIALGVGRSDPHRLAPTWIMSLRQKCEHALAGISQTGDRHSQPWTRK